MSDQSVAVPIDRLDQRLPAAILPGEQQRDKRFELHRVHLEIGQIVTLRFPVLPDTFIIFTEIDTNGSIWVSLGPNVDPTRYVAVGEQVKWRLPGVSHFLTLTSRFFVKDCVVIAESGYPQLTYGAAG